MFTRPVARRWHSNLVAVVVAVLTAVTAHMVGAQSTRGPAFTDDFRLEDCVFASRGQTMYFILEPSYRLEYAGVEDGERLTLTISVLEATRRIGGIETRVVEERETENGALVEISRNYFAICTQTNTVFYFGEEVDIYKNGAIVDHEGSWLHGVNNARAGVIMPGQPLLGARYMQEIAPGLAMDRAEIVSLSDAVATPAGTFNRCLKVEETTPLEPGVREYKWHAPGIGLIQDGELKLVSHTPVPGRPSPANPPEAVRPVPAPTEPGRRYFPETQHTLGGGFRAYWEANGGWAVFGLPLTEEFREVNPADGKEYTVQYFERARFEHHPELQGTPNEVLLGLLGRQALVARGWLP